MAILHGSNMFAFIIVALGFSSCLMHSQTAAAAAATAVSRSQEAASSLTLQNKMLNPSANSLNKRYERSLYGFGPRMLEISHSKIPIELDLLVENDEDERPKRFDDYGHMRFGKRGGRDQFDDYGHMRFGRSV